MTEQVRCDACGAPTGGDPYITPTGRRLCPACAESFEGLAAGMLGGGGSVGVAVATVGWRERLRGWWGSRG